MSETEGSLLNGVEAEGVDNTEEKESEEKEGEETEEVKMPEGLDPALWDEENKAVKTDELLQAYNTEKKKALGLRQKLSEKGNYKPPKEVSEYTLPEDSKLDEVFGEDSKALEIMKNTALESNLTTAQFSDFLSKMIPGLIDSGALKIDKPMNEEEQVAQEEEYKAKEMEKLGKDANRIIGSVKNWGYGMVNRGILSKDELPVFQAFANDASSVVVLNKIMALTGEPSIPVKTAVPEGLPSRAEINDMIASKEYQSGDASVHKQVKAYFKAVHGD